MTIWPKNLFKAKNLTQKFITSYKIDPKNFLPAQKVSSENGTSRTPISMGVKSLPPPPPPSSRSPLRTTKNSCEQEQTSYRRPRQTDSVAKLTSRQTDSVAKLTSRQTDSVAKMTSDFALIICDFGEIWLSILRYEKRAWQELAPSWNSRSCSHSSHTYIHTFYERKIWKCCYLS